MASFAWAAVSIIPLKSDPRWIAFQKSGRAASSRHSEADTAAIKMPILLVDFPLKYFTPTLSQTHGLQWRHSPVELTCQVIFAVTTKQSITTVACVQTPLAAMVGFRWVVKVQSTTCINGPFATCVNKAYNMQEKTLGAAVKYLWYTLLSAAE